MEEASPDQGFQLSDNPQGRRFELRVDGELAAWSEYDVLKTGMLLTHTEVLPEFEGRGVGSAMARHALDEARRRSLPVIPVCPFIAGYLRKHPEYQELVSPEQRRAYRI